jgi:hypothetical protein
MADDEITITLEDETGITDDALDDSAVIEKPKSAPRAESADPVEDLKAQFAEQKQQTEREKQARETAERLAREATAAAERATQEAAVARTEADTSQFDQVTAGIAAAQSEADSAADALQAAQEAGDWAKAKVLQRTLARAEAKLLRLDEAKSEIEAERARRAAEPETRRAEPQQQRQVAPDPIEEFINRQSPLSRDWLKAHREFITDQRKNAKLVAAHNDAIAEGLVVESPEYFSHVETFVGLRQAEQRAPQQQRQNGANGNGRATAQAAPKRRPAVPVAPVNQASGGGSEGNGGTQVSLTPGEARTATDGTLIWNYDDKSGKNRFKKGDPIGLQEMARRKHQMQAQGLYDKSYVEN